MANRRVLRVVQADVIQPVGGNDFGISEYLLGGLLSQVNNRQHRYIVATVVSASNAAALAAAIEKIEQTEQWQLARAMNGDPSGEGIVAFAAWLLKGGFEMVEVQENVKESP